MTEEHPFNNRTMYGATKIAGEQFFRAFNEQHGLDYVGLRYMNVYGPRMDYKGTYVSVIMKVLDRIEAGEPPLIFGDGSPGLRLRPRRRRRARQHPGAEGDATDVNLQRRHRREDHDQGARRHAARDHRQRRRARVPAAGADVRHPPRRQHRAAPSDCWASAPRWPCATACARSSSGGAPTARRGRTECLEPTPAPAPRRRCGSRSPSPSSAQRGARGRPAAARERLGRPGPVRRGVRGALRGLHAASPHAVATTSCTTALHLAVAALGLGRGDEVIVPAFTWVSTANVVEYMGATPRLLRRRPRDLQHRRGADRGR